MASATAASEPTAATLEAMLEWFRREREAGPIHHDTEQPVWQVFGYAVAEQILSDPDRFSSDFSGIMPSQRDFDLFARGNFVRMDPPKHRKLRGLVSKAFTPRVVTGLAPRIAALTAELLDRLARRRSLRSGRRPGISATSDGDRRAAWHSPRGSWALPHLGRRDAVASTSRPRRSSWTRRCSRQSLRPCGK